MSYSSIGRGSLSLTELDSQKKKNIKVQIKNDGEKTIAVLELNAQFIYSVRKIYQQELKSIKSKISFLRAEQKAIEEKIESLTVLCPKLKRYVNLDFYEKNKRKIVFEAEMGSKFQLQVWIMSILVYVLIACNILLSITNSNLAELAALLVLVLEMHFDNFMKYKNAIIFASICFIGKDILYLLLFSVTDFTQQIGRLLFGQYILRANTILHLFSVSLKAALAFLIMFTEPIDV